LNVRRTNLTLRTLAATLAVAAVLCAAWGVIAPVRVDVEAVGPVASRPATTQTSPDSSLPLAAFEPIWALDLRRPLTDPAAPTNPPTTTDVVPPAAGAGGPFVLVGTIGDSLAMIQSAPGVIEVKAVGDVANGAKIVAIHPMRVDVDLNGQRLTIAKPKDPDEGG
jgi:hypothetical protein